MQLLRIRRFDLWRHGLLQDYLRLYCLLFVSFRLLLPSFGGKFQHIMHATFCQILLSNMVILSKVKLNNIVFELAKGFY